MASTGGSSGSGGGSGSTSKDPWAWLGLLKWSLAYSDGTSTDTMPNIMSDEDRAFLEAVMKEGIIDENERMKVILQQVAEIMSEWKEKQQSQPATADFDFDAEQVDQVQDLLQEVRDIVEQIDYARAFCALGGLDFLLGTLLSLQHVNSSNIASIPYSIVELCSGIIATLSTNNPPVQAQLLEMGSIRILTNAYFACDTISALNSKEDINKVRTRLQSRILQAMSANVRSHAVAEQVFCETAQAVPLLHHCLGVGLVAEQADGFSTGSGSDETTLPQPQPTPPLELQQRGLFFLRALITSDSSTPERIQLFAPCIATVMDRFVFGDYPHDDNNNHDDDDDAFVELREMTLAMIQQLLEAASSSNESSAASSCPPILWSRKDALAARGVQRVPVLRAALSTSDDEDEYTRARNQNELDHWEAILVLLARATPPAQTSPAGGGDHDAPLMIAAAAPETTPPQ